MDNFVLNPEIAKQEKITLKAYTLLASLTKRISLQDFQPEDKNIYLTLVELIKSLQKQFAKNSAEFLATAAAMKSVKHQKTASIINAQICRRMNTHFKL